MPSPRRRKTTTRFTADRVFFWVLAAILAISPLPWGSVAVWAASLWSVLVCLCLTAWSIRVATQPDTRVPVDAPGSAMVLLALLVAAIVLQTIPWLPDAWHHPLWDLARSAGLAVSASDSINPFATGTALMNLITAAGVFWLTLVTCRSVEVKERLLRVIIAVQLAYALSGVVGFLHPFGVDPDDPPALTAFAHRFSATFVNPNTYAAFANLGALCCAVILVRIIDRGLITDRGRAVLRRSFLKALLENGGWWLAGFVLLASASLLSGSRGGMISLAGGLLVLALTQGSTALRRHLAAPAALALIAALGLGAFWLSGEKTAARLSYEGVASDLEGSGRVRFWEIALDAITARPVLGSGFGTFADVSTVGRSPEIGSAVERAHNDYLEFAADLGLPLFGVWLVILASIAAAIRRRWRADDRHAAYGTLAFAAMASLALHSIVDFPLQIPANAYLFACLLALPLGRSARSAAAGHEPAAATTGTG